MADDADDVDAASGDRGARALRRVVVVLVRTHSAGNVGSVARLCANHGCQLRLVTPSCDPLSKEARTFAASDAAVLEGAPTFASLQDALDGIDVAVGTSSKLLTAKEAPVLDVTSAARLLPGYSAPGPLGPGQSESAERVAFVFGNERDGLSVEEGALCHRVVRLHTPGVHDSLNLSHAVCAVLTLLTAAASTSTERVFSARSRERLIEDWLGLLAGAGYFKLTTPSLFRSRLARLVDGMHLDDRDAALLQGMLRALTSSVPTTSASSSTSSREPS